jgi:hypothetical protein
MPDPIRRSYPCISGRQPALTEFLRMTVLCLGARERLAAQQVAARGIGDGERIAVTAVGEHELAFVIRAPQLIRS